MQCVVRLGGQLQAQTNPVDKVWRLYDFEKLRKHASEDKLVVDASLITYEEHQRFLTEIEVAISTYDCI